MILYIGLFTEGLVLLIVEVLHSHVTELAGEWGYLFVPVRYQVFIRNRELPKRLY